MAEVRWTPQAAEDLDAAAAYIAQDSPHYASLFVLQIINAVERLDRFPQSGRIVPESDNREIREILHGNYRIVYRLKYEIVEILTVYHGSRLLDPDNLK